MRDLILLIAGLVLVTVLIVGGMHLYDNGKNDGKSQNNIAEVTSLISGVQAIYSGYGAFTSLTDAVVIHGGRAPKEMISGTSLTDQWGGPVSLAVDGSNAAEFDLSEQMLPPSACTDAIAAFEGSALGMSINGTAETLPLDPGTATSACAGSSNTVTIVNGR